VIDSHAKLTFRLLVSSLILFEEYFIYQIALASLFLSTILIHEIAFLVFLSLCYIPEILGGLFQISIISQSLQIFILIIGTAAPPRAEGKEINTKLLSLSKNYNLLPILAFIVAKNMEHHIYSAIIAPRPIFFTDFSFLEEYIFLNVCSYYDLF
jgi:hypothetical protein